MTLVQQLDEKCRFYKVGSELFTASGADIIQWLRDTGCDVFLDLKFHDIPNTVAKAVANATRLNVQMLTVHTSGGSAMMQAAEQAAQETAREMGLEPPLVLGVTVLTSLSSEDLGETGQAANVGAQVERLALLAARAGLRGLVCSPLELAMLRQTLPGEMQFVTPGIRATTDSTGDQKRTLSAREAIQAGASWLVLGRPIYGAADPRAAAEKILASLPSPGDPPRDGFARGFGAP
jgi:orotidine-5'-phosphate decarboxylase